MQYISTRSMTREEWLSARRNGVGGSDAAAILGQNPWSSPLSVYMDKIGVAPDKQETEAMRQGVDCEDVVARRFQHETGLKVQRCNKMFTHPHFPWMIANIDRQIAPRSAGRGEFIGLECKTTSPYNKSDFESGEIPPTYFWQCQHYMAVTGAKVWYLAVMVFSTAFHVFRIERDENAISQLIDAEREFWLEHVVERVPPYPIGMDADDLAIEAYNAENRADRCIAIDDMRQELDSLALYEAESKALDQKIKAIKQAVRLRVGNNTEASCGRWGITYRDEVRTTIDSKRLRAELPEIYAQYARESVSRPLKIKEVNYGA